MLSLKPSYSIGMIDTDVEIPRLCSSGSKSDTVLPSSTRPIRWVSPLLKRSASVRVVFPALPWPTRATLRILAEGNVFTPASEATGRAPGDGSVNKPVGGWALIVSAGWEPGRRVAARYTQRDARERPIGV